MRCESEPCGISGPALRPRAELASGLTPWWVFQARIPIVASQIGPNGRSGSRRGRCGASGPGAAGPDAGALLQLQLLQERTAEGLTHLLTVDRALAGRVQRPEHFFQDGIDPV